MEKVLSFVLEMEGVCVAPKVGNEEQASVPHVKTRWLEEWGDMSPGNNVSCSLPCETISFE